MFGLFYVGSGLCMIHSLDGSLRGFESLLLPSYSHYCFRKVLCRCFVGRNQTGCCLYYYLGTKSCLLLFLSVREIFLILEEDVSFSMQSGWEWKENLNIKAILWMRNVFFNG